MTQALVHSLHKAVSHIILTTVSLQDVTEIIGSGKVDLGYKAMIHTLAV